MGGGGGGNENQIIQKKQNKAFRAACVTAQKKERTAQTSVANEGMGAKKKNRKCGAK